MARFLRCRLRHIDEEDRSHASNHVVAAALCVAAGAPCSPTKTSQGFLRVVEGAATLIRVEDGRPEAAQENTPALAGDRLSLAPGSRVEVILPDGHRLRLAESADLELVALARSLDEEGAATALQLSDGALAIDVPRDAVDRTRVDTDAAGVLLERGGLYLVEIDDRGADPRRRARGRSRGADRVRLDAGARRRRGGDRRPTLVLASPSIRRRRSPTSRSGRASSKPRRRAPTSSRSSPSCATRRSRSRATARGSTPERATPGGHASRSAGVRTGGATGSTRPPVWCGARTSRGDGCPITTEAGISIRATGGCGTREPSTVPRTWSGTGARRTPDGCPAVTTAASTRGASGSTSRSAPASTGFRTRAGTPTATGCSVRRRIDRPSLPVPLPRRPSRARSSWSLRRLRSRLHHRRHSRASIAVTGATPAAVEEHVRRGERIAEPAGRAIFPT